MFFVLALLAVAATCLSASPMAPHLEAQQMVDYLNKKQSLFKAEIPKMSYADFKSRLMDVKYFEHEKVYAKEIELNEEIPESFDARENWPDCESLRIVRDQANCGSCWAVSAASTMSDRLCIQSEGSLQSLLSDTDILSCCSFCGYGCDGGYMDKAWEYVEKSGSCTGGAYKQKDVCKPYSFHPCGRHRNQTYYGECSGNEETPACRRTCQLTYSKDYKHDKIYASNSYDVLGEEAAIQKEIMKNGPVQAGFNVFEDFRFYKEGIYKHTWGAPLGGHAIKVIGWGVQNGTKYWTIANSWNSDWGEDGHFRMLRGVNECGLESWVVAGMMKVQEH